MRKIGSQTRETLEEAGYTLLGYLDFQKESAVIQANGDPSQREVWGKKDDHAGYTIEIGGVGYEFVRDFKPCGGCNARVEDDFGNCCQFEDCDFGLIPS